MQNETNLKLVKDIAKYLALILIRKYKTKKNWAQ